MATAFTRLLFVALADKTFTKTIGVLRKLANAGASKIEMNKEVMAWLDKHLPEEKKAMLEWIKKQLKADPQNMKKSEREIESAAIRMLSEQIDAVADFMVDTAINSNLDFLDAVAGAPKADNAWYGFNLDLRVTNWLVQWASGGKAAEWVTELRREIEGALNGDEPPVQKPTKPKPAPAPKPCPPGKVRNPATGRCINDTPANRKKTDTKPKAPEPEAPPPPKEEPKPAAKKGNPWMDHVREHYERCKRDNPEYKWSDAMKDAKATYNKA
eukprot:jgi/Tetstr1/454961/TSEL_041822.t1